MFFYHTNLALFRHGSMRIKAGYCVEYPKLLVKKSKLPCICKSQNMKIDEAQLLCLGEKARINGGIKGTLQIKSSEPRIHRWQRRYCCIHRNMLFYFESEHSAKPSGVVFLEHCTCLVVPTADEKVG